MGKDAPKYYYIILLFATIGIETVSLEAIANMTQEEVVQSH